jgi:pimeloyl-ACP methyl ester carboxylesterase
VGNSVGGSCALEIAWAAPDRVRGIVLVGTKAGVRRDPVARDAAVALLREQGIEAAWCRYWGPLFSPGCDERIVAAARRLALQQNVDDLIIGVRAFHDRRDHTDLLTDWSGRLILVNGAQDRTPTPAAAANSAQRARHDQAIIENSGHYVPLEHPDALDRILAERLGRSAQA